MNVAVTGGRGNIGGCVLAELRKKGWNYRTLGRRAVPAEIQAAGGEHLVGNITDQASVQSLVESADVLMHLARTTHRIDDLCEQDFRAMQNLIPPAVERRMEFIFTSSQCVHGSSSNVPRSRVAENSPFLPDDPYGVMKLAWEKMLEVFRRRSGLRIVIYRFPAVIPAMLERDHFIARFLAQAARSGTIEYAVPAAVLFGAGTSIVQAEDAARVMVNNIGNDAIYGQVFMVCEDQYLTWKRLAEISREILAEQGVACRLRLFTDPAARRPAIEYHYDNERARKSLGYSFAPDFQALRRKLADWWVRFGGAGVQNN